MGSSLQRLIILTIMLDLILILVGNFYVGTTSIMETEIQSYESSYENFNSNFSDTYGSATPDTETTVLERTFGDQKFGGQMFWSVFKAGVTVPKACQSETEDLCPEMERLLLKGYSLAFVLINLLLLFEIFLILYTKKN